MLLVVLHWSIVSQQLFCGRIRKSSILLIGLGGLGSETSKNLVLAGIRGLTILDSTIVTSANSSGAQFFLRPEDAGKTVGFLLFEAGRGLTCPAEG